MVQAFLMFCVVGEWATCQTFRTEDVLPRDVCEASVTIATALLRGVEPPEAVEVIVAGECRPVALGI